MVEEAVRSEGQEFDCYVFRRLALFEKSMTNMPLVRYVLLTGGNSVFNGVQDLVKPGWMRSCT